MAVPTITGVSPSTGPAAGGDLVTITGTNFKIPTLVYTIPTPTNITPTVSVTIGGRAVRRVEVISATKIRVLTSRYWHQDPRTDAFTAVSIVVSNLSSSGVVIPGEVVTKTSAYTYQRWVLGAPRQDPPTSRIAKEFMQALAIEVERNTYRATSIDYGEEGSAIVISEANLPSINVTMNIQKDIEYCAQDNYPEEILQNDGSYDLYEGGRTVQLVFDLLLAGATAGEAEHLCQAVQDFIQVNPLLTCSADPTLYAGLEDGYPIEIWRDPQQTNSPGNSGMIVYSMEVRVRGIRTLPDDPTQNVKTISTMTLTLNHINDGVSDGVPKSVDILP